MASYLLEETTYSFILLESGYKILLEQELPLTTTSTSTTTTSTSTTTSTTTSSSTSSTTSTSTTLTSDMIFQVSQTDGENIEDSFTNSLPVIQE